MVPQEQILRFGGGVAGTDLTTLSLLILAVASLLIFLLPRKYLIIPFLAASLLVPFGEQVVIIGLHFMVFRLLLIAAWLKVLISNVDDSGSRFGFHLNVIDKAVIVWAISAAVTFVLLWGEWGAVVERMGFLYNTLGLYFLFRTIYQTEDAFDRTITVLAVFCVVIAVVMLCEQFTGRNVLSFLGGVPQLAEVRDGRIRAQGAFGHPILAGVFGATMLPLFVGLWWRQNSKRIALIGIAASTVITFASMSSTPTLALAAAILGLCMWPLRESMRVIRWGIALTIVALHMVMKAPVWALIGRVDLTGSSSSYHRFQLVDETIRHFSDWWLVGTQTTGAWGWDLWDTSNTYVETALQGGLITLVLFILIFVYCYKQLGSARRCVLHDPAEEKWIWALGVALLSNLVAFVGITYFDQTIIVWFALLAMISSTVAKVSAADEVEVSAYPATEDPECLIASQAGNATHAADCWS